MRKQLKIVHWYVLVRLFLVYLLVHVLKFKLLIASNTSIDRVLK